MGEGASKTVAVRAAFFITPSSKTGFSLDQFYGDSLNLVALLLMLFIKSGCYLSFRNRRESFQIDGYEDCFLKKKLEISKKQRNKSSSKEEKVQYTGQYMCSLYQI